MKTVVEMADEVFDRMPPDGHCRERYWTATEDELKQFHALARNEALDELAAKLVKDFRGAFGDDTCASWAVWIREQKT